MDIFLPEISNTDIIVYAVPLYVYTVPRIVKDFLDRQIPLLEPYLLNKDGITSHPRRNKSGKSDIFLISVAGFPERSYFDVLIESFNKMILSSDKTYIGDILVGGAEMMSNDNFQDNYRELYKSVEQAGFEVATNGVVSKNTNDLIIEISTIKPENIKSFNETSNKYWDSFKPKDYSQVEIKKQHEGKPLKLSSGGIETFLARKAKQ